MIGTRVDITLDYPYERAAQIVHGAIAPEMDDGPSDRSTQEITLEGKQLLLSITAEDVSPLRASLNNTWRWLKLTSELIEV